MQVLRLSREAGLVKLDHVALDGTDMKANASKQKAMSYAHCPEPKLAAEVAHWLKAAAQTDCKHDAERRGAEKPGLGGAQKPREAKAALEAAAQAVAVDKSNGHGEDPSGSRRARRSATRPTRSAG